jgi:hypothetical protein
MRLVVNTRCHLLLRLWAALMWPAVAAGQSSFDVPQTNLAPISPPPTPYSPPATGYGSFDPYAAPPPTSWGGGLAGNGNSFGGPGTTAIGPPTPIGPPTTAPGGSSFFNQIFGAPGSVPPPSLPPTYGAPASGPAYGMSTSPYDNPNVYGGTFAAPPPTAGFPSSVYPSSSPSTLFPGGLFDSNTFAGFSMSNPSGVNQRLGGPRIRYAFIGPGSDADDLQVNDLDLSLVMAFPNFFYTQQPLYVVPSFSFHFWDGPNSSTGADLPPVAYSAFLDTGWQTDPNQMFGAELGVRVGVFSDFDYVDSDSLRVTGKGLLHFRLTPNSTIKGGVYVLDRDNSKVNSVLPAGGLLWQPNPFTRFDLFYPEPKFARYCRTIGVFDTWWYLAGEFGGGGGVWTIRRENGDDDTVDINDYRVMTGFEWGESNAIRAGRRTAFAEIGLVFDREIEYDRTLGDTTLGNSLMFRLGWGY